MWRVIKAELEYRQCSIMFFAGFSVLSFIVIWFWAGWERNRIPLILLIMFIATIMSYLDMKSSLGQPRDRVHVLLPIPLRYLGVMHLATPLIIWLGMVLIFFLTGVIVRPFTTVELTNPSLTHLGVLNGLLLFVIALYHINSGLQATITHEWKKVMVAALWLFTYFAVILPFYIVTNFAGVFGEKAKVQSWLLYMLQSPLWINVIGVAFCILSYRIFLRRRSYRAS